MMPPGLTSMVPLPGPLLLLKSRRYGCGRAAQCSSLCKWQRQLLQVKCRAAAG